MWGRCPACRLPASPTPPTTPQARPPADQKSANRRIAGGSIPALAAAAAALVAAFTVSSTAADPVYSGLQPGETLTPFRVLDIAPPSSPDSARPPGEPGAAPDRDPVREAAGRPLALVFIHTIERSLVPLLRAIDTFGAERQDRLRTEIVFLTADRLEGERRVRAASGSLRLKSRVGLSPDGAEGPGNYGLNRECMMTILVAKDRQVLTNFALVQPGIADAPAVLGALAGACGDTAPLDLARYTAPPAAGRDAAMRPDRPMAGEPFPGAVPTDPALNRLIRQFIRPTNDVATVDRLLTEIEGRVQGNADLTRQAIDGWTRILHFGDRYGTAHARQAAQSSLDRLKAASAP